MRIRIDSNRFAAHKVLTPTVALIALLSCNLISRNTAYAQPTPVDLTELGLEEILAMPIVATGDESEPVELTSRNRFRFGYEYVQARFEHYQDGTDRLSVADVFAAGFPVVPARITQEAHLFKIGYQLNDRTSLNLQVPYIRQSTFHFGDTSRLAPQFGEFTIDTQGLGDTLLSTSYVVWTRGRHALVLDGGFSFPTGAIDMLGRTPRNANQDTLVPYTMQLGSGTVDFKPAITYIGSSDWLEWGTRAQGTVRLGKNYRDYSLSDRFALRNWVTLTTYKTFQPSLRLATEIWTQIHGADTDLFVPTPTGPFTPAPVTDPELFGGEKVSVGFGVRIPFRKGFLRGQSVDLDASVPVYQSLNGPQPGEEWRFGISWNWAL